MPGIFAELGSSHREVFCSVLSFVLRVANKVTGDVCYLDKDFRLLGEHQDNEESKNSMLLRVISQKEIRNLPGRVFTRVLAI